jgi:hypothetical protein
MDILMNKGNEERRKLSGNRVLAECQIVLPVSKTFDYISDNVKIGYVVLNSRGGCFYLQEHFTEKSLVKFFPDRHMTILKKLTLFPKDKPKIIFNNIKVAFLRLKKEENREGIVFQFADITEEHLDILETLRFKLPLIGSNEQTSVPLNEIISQDRSDSLELLELPKKP